MVAVLFPCSKSGSEVQILHGLSLLLGTESRLQMFSFLILPPFVLPSLTLEGYTQLMHLHSEAACFLSHE
ncbi:uncharacterized protein Bfra_008813 [Botrytis fragariae]|uniref:Uncharacterized protein n=1 Tax=Botrytis fragariae TaxID=1964551 RepID=A0A8H6AQT4_9HELO|nr:uncharacterized protein Bfra_008813 [Botrytis fragariae]KAF5871789.1 hypothetical protein Bfra_008813 [Botrytis fragariae]